jgi:hypothetical protein
MRQLLLTTAIVVPLGFGYAWAQEAQEPAEEGEAEVQVIEPETVESPDAEATAAGEAVEETGEAVEQAGDAVGEAAEETGEAVEGVAEEAEGEVQTLEVETVEEGADQAVATEGATDEAVVREQAQNELRVDWITDAALRSPDGETIGGIEDVILDAESGQLSAVIVGVGGFLGIGEKRIAVAWDQLEINYDANEVRSDLTREEAEAAPEYAFRAQEVPPPPEGTVGTGIEPGAGGVGTAPPPPPAADN